MIYILSDLEYFHIKICVLPFCVLLTKERQRHCFYVYTRKYIYQQYFLFTTQQTVIQLFIFPQTVLRDIRRTLTKGSSYLILLKSLITFHAVKTEAVKWMALAQKKDMSLLQGTLQGKNYVKLHFLSSPKSTVYIHEL